MIKNAMIGIAFVASIAAVVILGYNAKTQSYYYVDTSRLYAGFDYTKQSNKELEQVVTARKHIMDSVYEKVRELTERLNTMKIKPAEELERVNKLQQEYAYKKEAFEND